MRKSRDSMKPRQILSFAVLFSFASCTTKPAAAPENRTPNHAAAEASAPAKKASKFTGKARYVRNVKVQGFEEEVETGAPLLARGGSGDGVTFAGNDRKKAKISVSSSAMETTTLPHLLNELEHSDAAMQHHEPPISKAANSGRIAEEDRNVTVVGYIHFAKNEADNDYHVILGSNEDPNHSRFMNVEISGLPPAGPHRPVLTAARNQFESVWADAIHGSGYTQFEPIKVRLSGSLFYDIDHAPGNVGPAGFRPKTAWEIHPVTKIEVLE
jgi:hypothetical protein